MKRRFTDSSRRNVARLLAALVLTASLCGPASGSTGHGFDREERKLNELIGPPVTSTVANENWSIDTITTDALTIDRCIFSVRQKMTMRVHEGEAEIDTMSGIGRSMFAADSILSAKLSIADPNQEHASIELRFESPIVVDTSVTMKGETLQDEENSVRQLIFRVRNPRDAERALKLFRSVMNQCQEE